MPTKIFFNGKEEKWKKDLTISGLLIEKDIRPEVVTVEVNDNIIQRRDYGKLSLNDGDRVEVVFFMGGG